MSVFLLSCMLEQQIYPALFRISKNILLGNRLSVCINIETKQNVIHLEIVNPNRCPKFLISGLGVDSRDQEQTVAMFGRRADHSRFEITCLNILEHWSVFVNNTSKSANSYVANRYATFM